MKAESYLSDVYEVLNRNCSFDSEAWKTGIITALSPRVPKNCTKLFEGNEKEAEQVMKKANGWRNSLSDDDLLKMARSCTWVRHYFVGNLYITNSEKSFPLAFTLVVYNNIQQIVRFLRAIYRAHNQYCIFSDSSSTRTFKGIVKNIAHCLPNVHVASKLIRVDWAHQSIMRAQLQCFEDLFAMRRRLPESLKWKYSINLCGKELPMATNKEIVSHLMKLNGTMAIANGMVGKDHHESLWRLQKRKIPFNLPYYKNSAYMGIPHEFIKFIFTDPMAIKVRKFFEKCLIPEEHFYSTLGNAPGVPGGYNRALSHANPFLISQSIWHDTKKSILEEVVGDGVNCIGRVVHFVCISNVGGLPIIMKLTRNGQNALFYNKYFMEYDHTIMDCMEEELVARNKKEFIAECGNE